MAPSIEVLKCGYSFLQNNIMKANCTCSLILENKNIVLVDTLTAWDAAFLLKALKEMNLTPEDITHVVGTHGHSDHIGNLNLFTKATHIVGQSISHKDEYQLHSFNNPYKISENVEIIATPGHTASDVSVIVQNTSMGTVAIVGDLFEREEDIINPDLWVAIAGSENPELQYKHRNEILHLAHFIIPGHGPGFKVTKALVDSHKKPDNV